MMKCLTSLLHILKKSIRSLIQRIGLKFTIQEGVTSALKISGLEKKDDTITRPTETKSDITTGADSAYLDKKDNEMLKVFESEIIKKAPEPVNPNIMCKRIGYGRVLGPNGSVEVYFSICNNVEIIMQNDMKTYSEVISKEVSPTLYKCLLYPDPQSDKLDNYFIVEMFENEEVVIFTDLHNYYNFEWLGKTLTSNEC